MTMLDTYRQLRGGSSCQTHKATAMMENPLTLNQYGFCLNDPVDRIDPSGHVSALDGTIIHDHIETYYEFSHPNNDIITEEGVPTGIGYLFPDIVDFTQGQVAEIKPLSIYGLATGYDPRTGLYRVA